MLAVKPAPTTSHIQLRPGVKPNPPMSYRVRITNHTTVKGVIFWAGSVVEVMQEDYALLYHNGKGVRVDDATPLHNSPQPPEPSDLFPARIVELVSLGLNTPKELATELGTTLGTVLKIVKALIAEGKIAASDKGYTIKKA